MQTNQKTNSRSHRGFSLFPVGVDARSNFWLLLVVSGCSRLLVVAPRCSWLFLVLLGRSCLFRAALGCSSLFLAALSRSWRFLPALGCSRLIWVRGGPRPGSEDRFGENIHVEIRYFLHKMLDPNIGGVLFFTVSLQRGLKNKTPLIFDPNIGGVLFFNTPLR